MEFIKKNYQYIGIAGCVLLLIGNFLPFATVTVSLFGVSKSESVNFVDGDGYLIVLLAIAAGVMIYLKKYLMSLIPAIIGLFDTIYNIMDVKKVTGDSLYGLGKVSVGYGAWIMVLGALVAIASYVIYNMNENNGKFVMPKLNKETLLGTADSKFCGSCGSKVSSNTKFCPKCGKECK